MTGNTEKSVLMVVTDVLMKSGAPMPMTVDDQIDFDEALRRVTEVYRTLPRRRKKGENAPYGLLGALAEESLRQTIRKGWLKKPW